MIVYTIERPGDSPIIFANKEGAIQALEEDFEWHWTHILIPQAETHAVQAKLVGMGKEYNKERYMDYTINEYEVIE